MPPLATISRSMFEKCGRQSCIAGTPRLVWTTHCDSVTADRLGHFERPVGDQVAPLALAPRGHLQNLSIASTLPHSSLIPSQSFSVTKPFSYASNKTPAPKEKWPHSMPRSLMRSAR